MYTVTTNVPIPQELIDKTLYYPWHEMTVEGSAEVAGSTFFAAGRSEKALRASLYTYVKAHPEKNLMQIVFKERSENVPGSEEEVRGCRAWRVTDYKVRPRRNFSKNKDAETTQVGPSDKSVKELINAAKEGKGII